MLPRTRDWYLRQSHDVRDFDPQRLVSEKDGQRISVVLPALNEQDTVGEIVHRLRAQLVEEIPLIDEIIVVDSGSTDSTAAVARAAGAAVYRQSEILPDLGDVPGKGEALWKSLAVASGDIIAFIDSDLRDFDPAFAIGLVAPLILESGIHFVKGCYDRPLESGDGVVNDGGGRVTELVARPLINAWWPELAGFIQPLAGEYSARRETLHNIPFARGYGVELALLIDVAASVGLDAMAQVDLGWRKHRNASTTALSKMALQVQLTALSRLEREGRVTLTNPPRAEITTFSRSGLDGQYQPTSVAVDSGDRPPMSEVLAQLTNLKVPQLP